MAIAGICWRICKFVIGIVVFCIGVALMVGGWCTCWCLIGVPILAAGVGLMAYGTKLMAVG